jgi:hypothetical protein
LVCYSTCGAGIPACSRLSSRLDPLESGSAGCKACPTSAQPRRRPIQHRHCQVACPWSPDHKYIRTRIELSPCRFRISQPGTRLLVCYPLDRDARVEAGRPKRATGDGGVVPSIAFSEPELSNVAKLPHPDYGSLSKATTCNSNWVRWFIFDFNASAHRIGGKVLNNCLKSKPVNLIIGMA